MKGFGKIATSYVSTDQVNAAAVTQVVSNWAARSSDLAENGDESDFFIR